jgi:hypothetical protein
MTIDIAAMALEIEATCTSLEAEIADLRREKQLISTVIASKQEELDLAKSMRPRKRKRAAAVVVPDTDVPVE